MELKERRIGLSGSALKFLALLFMTIDHVGYMILQDWIVLRMIGRLAMPIFAYMIAEGCCHTKNKTKYFLTVFGMAVLCQLGYFFALRSLDMGIFVTFSMSIVMIFAADRARKNLNIRNVLLLCAAICGTFFLCEVLPIFLSGTDYAVDYGFWGAMLPVFIYLGKKKWQKLLFAAIALTFISLSLGHFLNNIQWLSLLALPILALYDGTRGKHPMKYFFYLYYPLHLIVLFVIGYFIFKP